VNLDKINVTEKLESARTLLAAEKKISPAFKAIVEMLIVIISLLVARLNLNSKNSSKPPSTDPNSQKKKRKKSTDKKPGAQAGHEGKSLVPMDDPDTIIPIKLDKRTLPRGHFYYDAGYEARQVIDIEINRVITEYRAQVLQDEQGHRYVASFPKDVIRPIQYGRSMKSHAVYLSQFQYLPYERLSDYFINEISIPISVGSLFNFNKQAYELLEPFDQFVKQKLIDSTLLHSDETGINWNGKRIWLHDASNALWSYCYPHEKRGAQAMNDIGILPHFRGTLVHDHWKPYYTFKHCRHALCNAHHIRELQWVIDNYPDYTWAALMQTLLREMDHAVNSTDERCLDEVKAEAYQKRYSEIIQLGEQEMPLPPPIISDAKKRGRKKKSKERNLLERLRDFKTDSLLFMKVSEVPFTNNPGEQDIRMAKIQQKISGCFKSMEGAKIFCRIRSYLLSAQKHDILPSEALKTLFEGRLPDKLLYG
jgi:transposase